ncbi:hypothetical protein EJ08DRAFT_648729 [Tothia fuscella]|uniref:Signal recognition particle subunit SRP72 n=1 Tax=Tothia fuscella TaxID=1048955 RepID=A0A9P4NTB3_9PEZI|nr:hypothetical protein EJ08DRAFT_648729 [Tothia fuscella]
MSAVPDLSNLKIDHSDEDALKAANAALKKSKTDQLAQHTRVVCLLKLDRYDDAVRALEEGGDKLKEKAIFEYAYALYKAGEFDKAEAIANNGDERGIRHVLAQTKYRLEKFDAAGKLYSKLAEPSRAAASEESDLRINSSAVDAQLQWKGLGHLVHKKKPTSEDLDAFESAYNAACSCIARDELRKGEVLLRRARDLCNASEELSEEEKKTELLPIAVQQICVFTRQGRYEEASQLSKSIDLKDLSDLSTRHIATVNYLAAGKELANPFLAHRQFHSSEQLPKNDLPFQYQTDILRQNEYVMDLLTFKQPGVARHTNKIIASHPSPSTLSSVNTLSVLNAAATARGETGKAALKLILPLLERRPADVGLLLTVIHLYLLTNNHGSAIELLEKFLANLESSTAPSDADARFAPGLVGTIVSLYNLNGRKPQIRTELAKAAEYWRSKRKPSDTTSSPVPVGLLRAAGTALLESTDPQDLKAAGEIFADLHDHDSSDRASAVGLIAAYAISEPSKLIPELEKSLTDANRVVSDIDAASLEDAGIAQLPAVAPATKEGTKKRSAEETDTKPKRIRASRKPKDFEEGKKMDPERWLPLRDRSNWKPKGKKGKTRAAGLTQGGAVEEEKVKPEATKTITGGGGANKNKKKKGKK